MRLGRGLRIGVLVVLSAGCAEEQAAISPPPPARSDADDGAPRPDGGTTSSTTLLPSVECNVPDVHTVDVPQEYGTRDGPKLALRYRVFRSPLANAPTVLVVPGGPGSDIMKLSATDPYPLGAVPPELFNIIYADARGSGCNLYPVLTSPEKVFTIDAVARDLLAVVRAEKLTNYLLYGASFGTTAATVAGALAVSENTPEPRRLVLEGTVGRAFASFEAYFAPFEAEWTRVKTLIDPAWRTEFQKEPWSTTLMWSREQWGAFISAQLILGDVPGEGHILHYWLSQLSAKKRAAQQYVANFMAGVGASSSSDSQLFMTIACRELWGSWHDGREIRDGTLRATGQDLCTSGSERAPYDSRAWALHVPITYFQGAHDPTTTVEQAAYHRDGQSQVERDLVMVADASHAPLTLGLRGRKCSSPVWSALATGKGLAAALKTCGTGDDASITHATYPAH